MRLDETLTKKSSAEIKLSKTQMAKMVQLGRFLSRVLWPLTKAGLPVMKNVFTSLAKSVLITLGLTAVSSVTDAAIQH